jgi:hypothetical protein
MKFSQQDEVIMARHCSRFYHKNYLKIRYVEVFTSATALVVAVVRTIGNATLTVTFYAFGTASSSKYYSKSNSF